jgi:hypothetical protein
MRLFDMNNGLIFGRAFYDRAPAADVIVSLDVMEGTSELNVGRGVAGQPQQIRLFTSDGRPSAGTQLNAQTGRSGEFALSFAWDFLGSGGLPNDTFPFFRAHAVRFLGERIPQMASVTRTRRRGIIMNSPRTVADLMGVNIPVDTEGAVGTGVDILSIWRDLGANTLPSPLIGRTAMESQMFLGYWCFEAY